MALEEAKAAISAATESVTKAQSEIKANIKKKAFSAKPKTVRRRNMHADAWY